MRATLLPLLLLIGVTSQSGGSGPSSDWAHYGGGPEQIRYSPLTQITPANVASLKVAWTYDTKDAFEGSEMQCQPVVAHGVLYATSPKLRVFALDAATGAEKWSFNPLEDEKTPSRTRIRGLMYWERGSDRRIYFGAKYWLYALDATTGKPLAGFGQQGRIDLRQGFRGRNPHAISVGVNTPGVFFGDLLVLGSVVPEGLPSGLLARRSFVASSPGTIENVLRGLLDSLAFIHNPANKPQVMKSLAKGLRLKRVEDAEDGYQIMLGLYEKKIYPSVDGIRNVIRLLGQSNEKIRRLKAEDLVDDSVVRKLEKEGRF
jgi:hypothetical protein